MVRGSSVIMLMTIFIICFTAAPYAAETGAFIPWDFNNPGPSEEKVRGSLTFPGYLLVKGVEIFSRYISPVDGDRCPMYPTCAAYSIEAIKKHGFFTGFVMTAGRLIHENNEMDDAPLVRIGNNYRYYDPVSNNDFWWHNPGRPDRGPSR